MMVSIIDSLSDQVVAGKSVEEAGRTDVYRICSSGRRGDLTACISAEAAAISEGSSLGT